MDDARSRGDPYYARVITVAVYVVEPHDCAR